MSAICTYISEKASLAHSKMSLMAEMLETVIDMADIDAFDGDPCSHSDHIDQVLKNLSKVCDDLTDLYDRMVPDETTN